MGCDIHMYIEYKRKEDKKFTNFGNCLNPGRNYFLFGLLCKGVRSDLEEGLDPKGLPERDTLGWRTKSDSILRIDDEFAENDYTGEWTTLEKAKRWEANGAVIFNNANGIPTYVTNPDWHSHTYINTEEFREQLIRYYQNPEVIMLGYKEPEYEAILAAMNSFQQNGYDCRIVIWFDN